MAVLLTSADQSAVPSPQQTPIFRAQADLVLLDVRVLDKDRRPIRGLSADEFSIFEDGKPQKLANFAEIAVPGVEPPRSVWSNETPLDVSTNEQPVARVWAFVIDDALIPMDPRIMRDTKALVRGLIERIGPSDQASVIFTADSRQAQPFTSDKARLLASMDKFAPGLASWGGSLNLDAQFHLGAVNTLRFVVEALEGIRNVKKSIVWVTPGIPANIEAALPQLITGGQAGTRDAQLRLLDLTKDLFRTARKANIPIYPIDPCGLDGLKLFITKGQVVRDQLNAPWVRSEDYMLAAAAETGGKAFIKSNDMLPAIDRLFIENDAYYLLAYVPSDASKARVSRRLEVKVQRSGLDVLTRTEVAPSPSRPRASAQQAAADALASPIPVGDLPMRVTAAPFAIPGGRNGVVLLVLGIREPIVSPSDQRITVNTEIGTAAYTMEGALRDGRKHTGYGDIAAGLEGRGGI